jgi:hypothetical protein
MRFRITSPLLCLCALLLALAQAALVSGSDLPQMCNGETHQSPSKPSESADCYGFGASAGELG